MVVYAHTRPNQLPSEWEQLETHAREVADLAESFCKRFAPGYGRSLGWLHDAGKYQPAFQQYLQKYSEAYDEAKSNSVPHSIVGALFAAQAWPEIIRKLMAWLIAAYHDALKNQDGLSAKLQD